MKLKRSIIVLFIIYLAVLLYYLFFAEMMGRTSAPEYVRYNLIPFREISRFIRYAGTLGAVAVFINLVCNVIAFVPFGLFVGFLHKPERNVWWGLVWSFDFSLAIELVQLVSRVGSFDVDDIILNTLGGALGIIIYKIIVRINNKKVTDKEPVRDEVN